MNEPDIFSTIIQQRLRAGGWTQMHDLYGTTIPLWKSPAGDVYAEDEAVKHLDAKE